MAKLANALPVHTGGAFCYGAGTDLIATEAEMAKVDDILEEMKSIGALGVPKAAPPVEIEKVEEVAVEQADPGTVLKDLRGPRMVELLDTAIVQLGVLQDTFREMRATWVTEGEGDRVDEALQKVRTQLGKVPTAPAPALSSANASDPRVVPADLVAASARVGSVAKPGEGWRGVDPLKREDPEEAQEEDVREVGQDRAMPPGAGGDETVVRSLGTQKVSLPPS